MIGQHLGLGLGLGLGVGVRVRVSLGSAVHLPWVQPGYSLVTAWLQLVTAS